MARDDWYRNSVWTEDIKADFFKRLNRSRTSYHKAQYLRIQAGHLQETGTKKNIKAALELLDLMLNKYPDESQLASAYLQSAQCLEYFQNYESAIESFRRSIDAEKEYPSHRVGTAIQFAWFAVRNEIAELYDEVISIIEPDKVDFAWPISQFKFFSILAVVSDYYGDTVPSIRFAKNALEAMAKQESPFRYHKALGLVKNPDKAIVKKIKKISCKK